MKHRPVLKEVPRIYYSHTVDSPLGPLTILVTRSGVLARILFDGQSVEGLGWKVEVNRYACGAVALQLDEYFRGLRKEFSLELALVGTTFQREVWYRIQKVEYGQTASYGELARKVGRKDAVRAVASAVAKNPVPLIIPCHRIIRKDGTPGFYARSSLGEKEGTRVKKLLLELEQA